MDGEKSNGATGPTDRSLLILYGTETGNAQDIAEDLDECAQRLRFTTKIEEMNNAQLVSFLPSSCPD
jgi:sulfite reductase alpha subunit-like flavoprotein